MWVGPFGLGLLCVMTPADTQVPPCPLDAFPAVVPAEVASVNEYVSCGRRAHYSASRRQKADQLEIPTSRIYVISIFPHSFRSLCSKLRWSATSVT